MNAKRGYTREQKTRTRIRLPHRYFKGSVSRVKQLDTKILQVQLEVTTSCFDQFHKTIIECIGTKNMSEQHCTKDLTDLLFSTERLANMNNLRKVCSYQASYHSFTRSTSSSSPKGRNVLDENSTQNAEFVVVQEGEQQSLGNRSHAEMESRAQYSYEKKYPLSVTEKGGPNLKHSRSAPIPFAQMVSCDDLLDKYEERKFDRKTWAMYNRITSHRKAQGSTTRIRGARKTFPRLPDVDNEGEYDNGSNRSINSSRKRLDHIIPFFPMS